MGTELQPILVTRKQAARLLNICERTVIALVHRGELPERKVGRRHMIPYASLLKFARRDHETGREVTS